MAQFLKHFFIKNKKKIKIKLFKMNPSVGCDFEMDRMITQDTTKDFESSPRL